MWRERDEMGGGLLAGSLCVSVGQGRWNLVWCVCSGLATALRRPLHWAPREREREREYMEERRGRLERRRRNGSVSSVDPGKAWVVVRSGIKTVEGTQSKMVNCSHNNWKYETTWSTSRIGVMRRFQKVFICLVKSSRIAWIFQHHHQISLWVLWHGFHWTFVTSSPTKQQWGVRWPGDLQCLPNLPVFRGLSQFTLFSPGNVSSWESRYSQNVTALYGPEVHVRFYQFWLIEWWCSESQRKGHKCWFQTFFKQ